ncbi:hypothetical protein D9M71_557120 [compost metagenome]
MPCPFGPPTVTVSGAFSTSSILLRLAPSVTITRLPAVLTRCSMAFGPKAVNSGWYTAPRRQVARMVISSSGVRGSRPDTRSPGRTPRL